MSAPPWYTPVIGASTAGGASVWKSCGCIRKLMSILGDADGDLCFLLPFLEGTLAAGTAVQDLSSRGLHASNITAVDNQPVIRGDLLSLRLNGADEYLSIPDNTLLTPIDAGVDAPFSVGCAFKMSAINAAFKNLISKWDDTTPNWEWRLAISDLEYPSFEVVDDSVAASNMGREWQNDVDLDVWYVLIGTYDGQIGGGAAPEAGMNLYSWVAAGGGVGTDNEWLGAVDDADVDGGGVYAAMENTDQPVNIGASFAGGAASEWFPGEIMLPWMTRRELSGLDARRAALTMVRIMGL